MDDVYKPIVNETAYLKNVDLFGDIVSRSYLQKLADCEFVDYPKKCVLSQVRWYSISKIVMEKDTFFPDKLSMLYIALHNVAMNVTLVVNKDVNGQIQIYLGARDFQGVLNVSGEILAAGLKGYLAGVKTKVYTKGFPGNKFDKSFISCVSGLASLRDDKKGTFVQGIEKLINATSEIPSYNAYFIADNVSNIEAQVLIASFNDLYNKLTPLSESQLTISESETEGTSETLTENFSISISKSISHTVTNSAGFSESHTHTNGINSSSSINKSPNILRTLWTGLVGGKSGSSASQGANTSDAFQTGRNTQKSIADQTGETNQDQRGESTAKGKNESTTRGSTRQITFKNNHAKCYLNVLESEIKRLTTGAPFGLWSAAAYFVAKDSSTAETLANLYRGCIIGEESSNESYGINVWKDSSDTKLLMKYLEQCQHPRFYYNGIDVSAGSVVTSKELAIHMSLPQSSIPGLLVREEQSFGRNVMTEQEIEQSDALEVGVVKHLGEEYVNDKVNLSIKGLSKHTFVTGTTGSGKSNTLYLFMSDLLDRGIKFMVIEPAKGEYKEVFGNVPGLTVYGSNPRISKLLSINPFEFPESIDIYEHIDSLVEIFNACWPMYAAMPQVLKHSIIDAYKACGWDMERSYNPFDIYPTIEDVLESLKEYINSLEYSADTKGDYKGSLETRLQSLCEGTVGRMFNNPPIPDEQLFNENVIVDLSRVKASETKSLLMGMLVLKLNEFRSAEQKGMNLPLRHITVLEEAHNLLKRISTDQSAESSNVAGMAVEKIANSMAEMRTYGEGFVIADQSPSLLDLATIRNTNTKIIMSLPEKDDKEAAGKSIGLDDKHIEEISRLKTGEALVYQNGWEEPVKTKIKYYQVKSQPWSYINESNIYDVKSHSLTSIYDVLYEAYTTPNYILDRMDFVANLRHVKLAGSKLARILKVIDLNTIVPSNDIALIFATIIDRGILDSAKSIEDIEQYNTFVSQSLIGRMELQSDGGINTYLNMYIKGCSLLINSKLYDDWFETNLNVKV